VAPSSIEDSEEAILRKCPRLQKKNISGKAIIKPTQDLVAKKYGVIQEDEGLEQMTLHKYLNLYN
jgi:hypothetical protein